MEYKIVSSSSPQGLTNTINSLMNEGWEPMGSHQVIIVREQNRFRGDQHIDTTNETEYSQTMVRKIEKEVIEVDVMFYLDNETNEKVFDEEGMREEFEYKLSKLK